MKKKVAIIYGTRPEFIKLFVLIMKIRMDNDFELVVINTGQHRDMLTDLENKLNVKPDVRLNVMKEGQHLNELISKLIISIHETVFEINPEIIIVQGDTTTVAATAFVAFQLKIPIAHVEAGLRSFDLFHPFPEEFNRRLVSIVAKLNFAPTKQAFENLRNEGVNFDRLYLTGNTIVDSVNYFKNTGEFQQIEEEKLVLITSHRRENHGDGLNSIIDAVDFLSTNMNDYKFVWPVHPNPNVKFNVYERLSNRHNIALTPPMEYIDLLKVLKRCKLIMTDSGGIQEEALSFRKKVIILRETTERPEVVETGWGILCGTDKEKIINSAIYWLNQPANTETDDTLNPFGDGHSTDTIIQYLKKG